MEKKFAVIDYVKTTDDVPIKISIIKKSAKLKELYIAKFNPFLLNETETFGAEGFDIKLPITMSEALADTEKAETIMLRTAASLKDMGVDIAVFPKGCESGGAAELISAADGRSLLPFFILAVVEKAEKILEKSGAAAEVLIIGNTAETAPIVQNIYADVNYLSLMTEEPKNYERLAAEVFEESGLNVQIFSSGKSIVSGADIIISLVSAAANLDYAYKRGAVFFDFSADKVRLDELVRKRGDMLVIDGLRLRHGDAFVPLEIAEAALYVRSREFRRLRGFYDIKLAKELKKELAQMDIKLAAFLQKGRAVSGERLQEFLKKNGLGKEG